MTWELILDGYSESSYSATPRFAAARLPWFAEQYVFCGEKDFSLVERMLADSERYRTGPRFTF
ncbi:hypothetical protein FQH92_23430 [Escherichia coli]|nr:hypothetical protein [Escherichia coli]